MPTLEPPNTEGQHRKIRYHFSTAETHLDAALSSLRRIRDLAGAPLSRREDEWTSDLEVIRSKLDEVKRALDEL
jgi:hypothetical protein